MLRYKEKDDIEVRLAQTEEAIATWRARLLGVARSLRNEFHSRLKISLIYHDAALEGDVLTYSEIKAAVDPTIISDASLIPSYEDIKRYAEACRYCEEFAESGKPCTLETVKEVYSILMPEDREKGLPYRAENPLHRLYYHEIVAPESIADKMEEFGEWMVDRMTGMLHPVERVAETHHRLMAIFPWAKQSGRCARIVSNLMLRQEGYPYAVIHSIDRQAYYESLRGNSRELLSLYIEAIETSAMSETRVYDEAERNSFTRHAS